MYVDKFLNPVLPIFFPSPFPPFITLISSFPFRLYHLTMYLLPTTTPIYVDIQSHEFNLTIMSSTHQPPRSPKPTAASASPPAPSTSSSPRS